MSPMQKPFRPQLLRPLAASLLLTLLAACSVLKPTSTAPPVFYSLDTSRSSPVAAPPMALSTTAAAAPTLVVSPPRASAGFDSQRIIYLREPYKLEYFANSEWVDPPAQMLGPLMVSALQASGAFRAVMLTPGSASGELRLDTQVIRLQHEFQTRPSRVRFTLRAYLVEDKTRRVVAWREFENETAAASDDPYGGVVAANQAVQAVLAELAAFSAQAARGMPPAR